MTKKRMEAVRETEKHYCSIALGIAVIAAIICFMLAFKPIGKGLILGSLFSAANFILMGETLPMRIGRSRKKAAGISFLLILLRYVLMAIPLVLSIQMAQFHLAATIIGLFSVQLVIMSEHISRHIRMKTRKSQVF
ncbi:MAG: ATP synthase subunit I [Desulfobacterales bacterium]|nr:ATP synthase subunit I [Desulfobacterales bacterium]